MALEFNIPPAESKEQLKENINKIKTFLSNTVGLMGLQFSKSSATLFPMDQLSNPKAMVFGCDPDFDAWNGGAVNPKPRANDWRLRSCGGHVHIGEKIESVEDAQRLIRWMDFCAGVPSTVLDDGFLRKSLYGKRGAYRIKPYGVEYRTLSNFWIWEDKLIDFVWNATQLAVENWNKKDDHTLVEEDAFIAQAINENNVDAANYLIDKYALNKLYA